MKTPHELKVIKNQLTDLWELHSVTDPTIPAQVIHCLEYEPDPEESYNSYIVYQYMTNHPALNLVFAMDKTHAMQTFDQMYEEQHGEEYTEVYSISQVTIEFNTPNP